MKNVLKISLIIGSMCQMSACTKKVDTGDFDVEAWQEDTKACNGTRSEMVEALLTLKPNLLGHYQKRIIKVLGEPEEQELYKRSQVYYIYYIDPAGDCTDAVQNPRKLEVRFTALGIANEVNIR